MKSCTPKIYYYIINLPQYTFHNQDKQSFVSNLSGDTEAKHIFLPTPDIPLYLATYSGAFIYCTHARFPAW